MSGRNDLGRGAGFVQSFAWLGEFDLLEAVGDPDGHIESFKGVFCHDLAPFQSWCSERQFAGALAQAPLSRASCRGSPPALVDTGLGLFAAILCQRRIVGVSLLAAAVIRRRIVGIEGCPD